MRSRSGAPPPPIVTCALPRLLRLRDAHDEYQSLVERGEPFVEFWFYNGAHILAILDPSCPVADVSDWFDIAPKDADGCVHIFFDPLYTGSEVSVEMMRA